jgi:6-phosphogluconolactonase/glucosamine-6-phosphate isomerase/deaminase
MTAGQLLLSAHGMSKREAVRRMLLDYPGPQNPAGWIQKHEHVHVFLDVEAFGELSVAQLEECGFQVDMALKEHVHR